MAAERCPNCDLVLGTKELADGWCDSCGKQIPPYLLPKLEQPVPTDTRPWPEEKVGFGTRFVRFIDGRSRWFLLIIGAALFYWGFQEYRVAEGTTAQPADADLAAVEGGQPLPQNHVRFGPHIRLHFAAIYAIDAKDKGSKDATVKYTLYPLISQGNPLLAALDKDADGPVANHVTFKVLVKTDEFKTVAQIPQTASPSEQITGLIINRIRPLEADEAALIRKDYPLVKPEEILVLEVNRKPASLAFSFAFMIGGAALAVLAVVCVFLARAMAHAG